MNSLSSVVEQRGGNDLWSGSSAARSARWDEVIHEVRYDAGTHAVTLTVPEAVKDWSVQVSY